MEKDMKKDTSNEAIQDTTETIDNNEVLELTEDELYEAAVMARTNGLLSILTDDLKEEARISAGANGFPCINANFGGVDCKISYFPVGDTDTDRFILMIRAAVLQGDDSEDHTGRMFSCESYNVASVYGTAVFVPTDGSVEMRVSIPERGGMNDASFYRFAIDMLVSSVNELGELLEVK